MGFRGGAVVATAMGERWVEVGSDVARELTPAAALAEGHDFLLCL